MTNTLDALAFSEIKTVLTDEKEIADLAKANLIGGSDKDQMIQRMNDVLKDTTIKRAICLDRRDGKGNFIIPVRIPMVSNYNKNDYHEKKFGYVDKIVYVPESLASKYPEYAGDKLLCDRFYDIYCANARKIYKDENDGKFSSIEWSNVRPDCSCFGRIEDVYQGSLLNGKPKKCYMPGCRKDNLNAYLDVQSRAEDCTDVICQVIVNIQDSDLKDTDIRQIITQNCSQYGITGPTGSTGSTGSTGPTDDDDDGSPATPPQSKYYVFSIVCTIIVICIIIIVIILLIIFMKGKKSKG